MPTDPDSPTTKFYEDYGRKMREANPPARDIWGDGEASEPMRLTPTPEEVRERQAAMRRHPSSQEVRVTDPETGGQKGKKLAQLGAVSPKALMVLAEVAGFGGEKYERYNFMKGYNWSLSYDALQRHLHAFWSGEDIDPESGLHHLGHAAWHALALLTFVLSDLGTDDRPPA